MISRVLIKIYIHTYIHTYKQGMAQWWERLPPTNVARVQIRWVCCWFSPLPREVFLRVLQFGPLPKNQNFQISIRPGIRYWEENVSLSTGELLLPLKTFLRQYTLFSLSSNERSCKLTLTKKLNNIANLRFPVIGLMRTISIWNFTCKIWALPTYQEIPEIPHGV